MFDSFRRFGSSHVAFSAFALAVGAGTLDTLDRGLPQEQQGNRAAQLALGDSIFHGTARDGNCFTCHGADAKGGAMGPDLTDGERLNGDSTVASIIKVIEEGVPSPKQFPAPMPGFKDQLKADDIKALAMYVQSLAAPAK